MKRSILFIALAMMFVVAGCHNNSNKENGNKQQAVETFDSPEALFEAITESVNAKQEAHKSIDLVNRLVADYPEYENNAAALFMLANFVYDEQLGNLDKARETYQRIIDEYPDSPFANDATIAITQLGIPLEDLVKMFESNEKSEDRSQE